ncbi:flavin-containing monooxygenase [Niallia sp. Krafla_26]|uniref:flavin-containing monooxygenase n=1 Tax=Niallia sp. Krafla_26 TaxID=3064703 RepID=UPI003D17F5A9
MKYDVIIIGAGQAGLSMGYYLKKTNVSFLILDQANEIGETWRNRYDSLTLFTPRTYSSLPGLKMEGDPNGYPTKDEVAQYLEQYGNMFSLPIQLKTTVTRLSQTDNGFHVMTDNGEFIAKKVVVATGPFQHPSLPPFSKELSNQVYQVHSSQYKNPNQLNEGSVLVVGGGNSGAQIAVEVSKKRDTYFSVSHKMKFLPQDVGSKSIFWYFDKLGVYRANVHSTVGQFLKKQHDPIFGFQLKSQLKSGRITLKPRTTSFLDDRFIFDDGSEVKVNNVIWATGFQSDYRWIDIPSFMIENGFPHHERGITRIDGLYFLGLAWQSSRESALIQGVGADARYLLQDMVKERV